MGVNRKNRVTIITTYREGNALNDKFRVGRLLRMHDVPCLSSSLSEFASHPFTLSKLWAYHPREALSNHSP